MFIKRLLRYQVKKQTKQINKQNHIQGNLSNILFFFIKVQNYGFKITFIEENIDFLILFNN